MSEILHSHSGDSDNWPSPPAKIKKVTSGPSNTRIASRAHCRTQSAETTYNLNIVSKAKESPVSTSRNNLEVSSDIDDDDLPNISLESPQKIINTTPIKTTVTTMPSVPPAATYTPSSQAVPVQQTPTSPVSAKKGKTKTSTGHGPSKNTPTKKGTLNIKVHAREKPKSTQKLTCSYCSQEEYSQAAMNAHHIATHDDVNCTKCTKTFRTPSSLSCHMYSHGPKRFMCSTGI